VSTRKATCELYHSFLLFRKWKCIISTTMFQELYRNRHNRLCGLLCQNQVSSSTTREQNFQQKASTRFSCTNYVTTNAPFQPTNFILLSLDPLLMSRWNYKCASKRTTQGKLLRSNSYIKVACAFHHGHLSRCQNQGSFFY